MLTLSEELRRRGHEVRFVGFQGRGLAAHTRRLGYPTRELRVRTKIDPLAVIRLARWLRREGCDVLHAHLSTSAVNGALAARLARVPGIATVHGMSGKLSFVACHHLIAVSAPVQRHLVAQGVHEAKISIVPNGLKLTGPSLGKQEARERLGLPPDVKVIGCVARLTALKGIDHLLAAHRRLLDDWPDVRCVVVGDGDLRDELVSLARSLGTQDHVVFTGYRRDVVDVLPALDVFVFPTLREAMGIALVEAMAAGLPVVATRVGGIPDVITEETGLLVNPGDPIALADAASQLLGDPGSARLMGEAGRVRAAEEFSDQRMALRTLQVYRTVISRFDRREGLTAP
jgi:glycosyltransferase involved in cell wall biosynthesis